MKPASSLTGSGPANDWDIKLPEWVIHFAPVLIALACLMCSLGTYSNEELFDERDPGTYLSLILMFTVFLLSLAAMGNQQLDKPVRVLAGLISLLTGVAMLDETQSWHEEVGRYVQKNLTQLPSRVTHYTDDAIIIMGTLVVGVMLLICIRRTGQARALRAYMAAVFVIALAHGVLDLIFHGGYMSRLIWPELSRRESSWIVDRFGFYEESCKVWCEWFVILFLHRLFHGRRGTLPWSLQVFAGMVLSGFAIWAVADPAKGVPYLTLSPPVRMLRNYPVILLLSFVWLAWAVMMWICLRHDSRRRALAGLLYLCPVAAWIGKLQIAETLGPAVQTLADVIPNAYYYAASLQNTFLALIVVLPGVTCGAIIGIVLRRFPALLIPAQLSPLLLALCVSATHLVLWSLTAGLVIVAGVAQIRPVPEARRRPAMWAPVAIVCVIFSAALLWFSSAPLMPNYKYRVGHRNFFRLRYQTLLTKGVERKPTR